MKLLRNFAARVRYLVDRVFDREFAAQVWLFVLLVLVATLIGMTAMFFGLFAESNADVDLIHRDVDGGVFDALWWSVNHVLSLPKFEAMYGASPIVLLYSFVLSLVSIGVFGILISLINNSMRSRIDALRRGDTRVFERKHVLLLGWSGATIAVLRQLAQLQPGCKVVILAPLEIDEMRERLRVAGIPLLNLTVILRSGTASNKNEILRVAGQSARSIIVLATSQDDSEAIKTLVQLAAFDEWSGEPPAVTVEIRDDSSNEIAQIASKGRAYVVSADSLVSRVIVQTIRNPGLSAVFEELRSIAGNNIVVNAVPQAEGSTIGELAHNFATAIPIGISWEKPDGNTTRHAVVLNPEHDFDLSDDDRIVFLSHELNPVFRAQSYEPAVELNESPPKVPGVPERIFLVGYSEALDEVAWQVETHAVRGTSLTVLTDKPADEVRASILKSAPGTFDRTRIEVVQGDPTSASAYSELDLAAFDCIAVLASSDPEIDADTQSLRTLLRISDLRSRDEQRALTIVEITDEKNREMFRELGVDDVVVSTDIVSMALAQVAQEPILGPIYKELLDAGGVEISLRPLADYIPLGTDFRFDDLIAAAQQKLEVALGVRSGEASAFYLNPDRSVTRSVTEDDKVVVLAQQIYQ